MLLPSKAIWPYLGRLKLHLAFNKAILFSEISSTDKIAHGHRGIYKIITTVLFVLTKIGLKKKKTNVPQASWRLVKHIMAHLQKTRRPRKGQKVLQRQESAHPRVPSPCDGQHRGQSHRDSRTLIECRRSPLRDSPKPAGGGKPLETGPAPTGRITIAT